jgi:hypothetical protein
MAAMASSANGENENRGGVMASKGGMAKVINQ